MRKGELSALEKKEDSAFISSEHCIPTQLSCYALPTAAIIINHVSSTRATNPHSSSHLVAPVRFLLCSDLCVCSCICLLELVHFCMALRGVYNMG